MHKVSPKLICKLIDNKNASRHCDYTDDFEFNHPDWSWNWSCLFWCVWNGLCVCVVRVFRHCSHDFTGCSVICGCSPEQLFFFFFFAIITLNLLFNEGEKGTKWQIALQNTDIFLCPHPGFRNEILLFTVPHNKIRFSPPFIKKQLWKQKSFM